MAGRTSQPGKTIFQLTAVQERLNGLPHHWTERSGLRLEALLVNPHVGLKVLIEDLVVGCAFRMPWSIDGGPIVNDREPHGGARDGGAVEARRFRVNARTACGVGRHSGA